MGQVCVFIRHHGEALEQRLYGRSRHHNDELQFGPFRTMAAMRLRRPLPGAQWSGLVTTLAARLLARQDVDAVITTGTAPGTRFAPWPILTTDPQIVLGTAGNKPCLSPNLALLDAVQAQGIRRLAVIGTSCQVQILRALEPHLNLERLDIIGIPCSDNVTYPDLVRFLRLLSRSPETIVHYEFMPDYRLWMRHEDGHIEKRNFIDFPMDKIGNVFPAACLACFDYANALADITIGYMGAPLGWQWVLARSERGEALLDYLRDDVETTPLISGGDRRRGMPHYIAMLSRPPARPPKPIRSFVALLQRQSGPRGLEFARSIIEMKLLRNLHYVQSHHGRLASRIVPDYVYTALAPYAEHYYNTLGYKLHQPK
jgi:coenzyme F420 hydrogenase subunit beta